jgi:hypothetical protein
MIVRTTRRRTRGPAPVGARGQLRYAAIYHRPGARPRTSSGSVWAPRTWWRRVADDQDFVGAKLVVLAALLVLTALLERVV